MLAKEPLEDIVISLMQNKDLVTLIILVDSVATNNLLTYVIEQKASTYDSVLTKS